MEYVRTLGGNTPRSGRHDRIGDDRYFYVTGQGWYALAREGLGGPYVSKRDAEEFVARAVAGELQPEFEEIGYARR